MPGTNLGNSALALNLVYYPCGSDKPPTSQAITPFILQVLGAQLQLPASVTGRLNQLAPFLSTSLLETFNQNWSASNPATFFASNFTQTLQQSGVAVSDVRAVIPQTGILWADATAPGSSGDPGLPGQLTFYFEVPGCSISYETSSRTPPFSWVGARDEWNVSFDFQLQVSTTVPLLPFTLSFVAQGQASNADNKPENLTADIDYAIHAVLVAVGSVANAVGLGAVPIAFGIPTEGETASQQLESGIDTMDTPIPGVSVGGLASILNPAGPALVYLGISQCGFSVAPDASGGDVLTLTLIHPLDPGPTIKNFDHPSSSQPQAFSNPPSLVASATEAQPGATISVLGTQFPVETSTQIRLEWNNSSTGPPQSAEIAFGGQTISVPMGAQFNNMYDYVAGGLQPNTEYSFRARCRDSLSSSAWSAPLNVTTAGGAVVELTLNAADQPAQALYPIGGAALSASSSNWACSGVIPATTPPGTYNLTAALSGQIIASTPLVIAEIPPERPETRALGRDRTRSGH